VIIALPRLLKMPEYGYFFVQNDGIFLSLPEVEK